MIIQIEDLDAQWLGNVHILMVTDIGCSSTGEFGIDEYILSGVALFIVYNRANLKMTSF